MASELAVPAALSMRRMRAQPAGGVIDRGIRPDADRCDHHVVRPTCLAER